GGSGAESRRPPTNSRAAILMATVRSVSVLGARHTTPCRRGPATQSAGSDQTACPPLQSTPGCPHLLGRHRYEDGHKYRQSHLGLFRFSLQGAVSCRRPPSEPLTRLATEQGRMPERMPD